MRNTAIAIAFMALLLGLWGCSADEPQAPCARVSFRVGLAPCTRATFGDGHTARLDRLQWSIFEVSADGSLSFVADGSSEAFAQGTALEATVAIDLVKGHTYRVAFCADNSADTFTTFAAGRLSVDYAAALSNDADADCFTGSSEIITVAESGLHTVTLTRPFAQLNWGTGDIDNSDVSGLLGDLRASVKVTSGLFTTYDVISGLVSGPVEQPVTFPAVALDSLPEADFPVSGYRLIAMNWLLTGSGTVDCSLTVTNTTKASADNSVSATVNAASVKPNHRTNIYGNLLTTDGKVSGGIAPASGGDINIGI